MSPPSSPSVLPSVCHPPTPYTRRRAEKHVGIKFLLFLYCYSLRNKSSQVRVLWEDHRNDLFINGFGEGVYSRLRSTNLIRRQVFSCRLEAVNSLGVCISYIPPFPSSPQRFATYSPRSNGRAHRSSPFPQKHSAADAGVVFVVDHHRRADLVGRDYISTI